MLSLLYDLAARLAQPLLRRKLARRGVLEPGYLHATAERFGRYANARPAMAPGVPLVWIHAVSLGETRAAQILLEALRQRRPDVQLLLTQGTATGRAEGIKLLCKGDVQVWLPWDTRDATQRFMRHFRPDVGVLMETEVWPNLLRAARLNGVPVALANARLSARSLRNARRAAPILRPAYASLAEAWAQTEADAERLRRAGAPQVQVLGNLKFDARVDDALLARGRAWRAGATAPVVLLASSREGEELGFIKQIQASALVGKEFQATKTRADGTPHVQWMIVPRHPQRFDEVARLVRASGLRLSRRSQWGEGAPDAADVWLGDSLGEMQAYYALADVALLGGSFEPLGGQNLIEAAACGCPVIMGPHTFNFGEAAELAEAAGAAERVQHLAQAVAAARQLLTDDGRRHAMREAARRFAATHRGAADRMAERLLALCRSAPPAARV